MNRLQYATQRVLNNINSIEDMTGQMFHEFDAEINKRFEDASNAQDERKMMAVLEATNKVIDSLNMD